MNLKMENDDNYFAFTIVIFTDTTVVFYLSSSLICHPVMRLTQKTRKTMILIIVQIPSMS